MRGWMMLVLAAAALAHSERRGRNVDLLNHDKSPVTAPAAAPNTGCNDDRGYTSKYGNCASYGGGGNNVGYCDTDDVCGVCCRSCASECASIDPPTPEKPDSPPAFEFYEDEEERVRDLVLDLFDDEDDVVGIFLRLGFHDGGSFDKADQTGGSHACMAIDGGVEQDDEHNAGLVEAIEMLEEIKATIDADDFFVHEVSLADLIQFTGILSIKHSAVRSVPLRPFRWGRIDCYDADPDEGGSEPVSGRLCDSEIVDTCSNDNRCNEQEDVECPRYSTENCRCSDLCFAGMLEHLKDDVFDHMGFDNGGGAVFDPYEHECCTGSTADRTCKMKRYSDPVDLLEWVLVVLSGGHNIGGMADEGSGFSEAVWTSDETELSQQYFEIIVDNDWTEPAWEEAPDDDHHQSCKTLDDGADVCYLVSDLLINHFDGEAEEDPSSTYSRRPNLKNLAICYANDMELFFEHFADLYHQLTEFDHDDLVKAVPRPDGNGY